METEEIEKKLSQRHLYQTPIGLVCMTKEEHEMYEEAKKEQAADK